MESLSDTYGKLIFYYTKTIRIENFLIKIGTKETTGYEFFNVRK